MASLEELKSYNNSGISQFKHLNITFTCLVSILISVVGYLILYWMNMKFAQWLKAADYGDYAAIMAIFQNVSSIIIFGTDIAVLKFLPLYLERKEWSLANGYLNFHNRIFLLLSVGIYIASTFLMGLLFTFGDLKELDKYDFYHPAMLYFWMIPIIMISYFVIKAVRSFGKIYISLFYANIYLPLLTILIAFFIHWLKGAINIYQVMFAFCISQLILSCYIMIRLYFIVPKEVKNAEPKFEKKLWVKVAFELLFSSVLISNLNSIFIILLEIFGKDDNSVGFFSAIITITTSIWLIYRSVIAVTAPMISKLLANNDRQGLQSLINLGNLIMTGFSIIYVVLLVYFGKPLLAHFGANFVSSYKELLIVGIGFAISMSIGMYYPILQYTENQRSLINLTIFVFILMLIISTISIIYFDIYGAAISLTVFSIMFNLGCAFLIKTKLKLKAFYLI